jgi:hypothetical protein
VRDLAHGLPGLQPSGRAPLSVECIKNIDRRRGYLSHRRKPDRIQLRRKKITRYNNANAPHSFPDPACEPLVAKNAHCAWLEAQNRGRTAMLPIDRTHSTQPNP